MGAAACWVHHAAAALVGFESPLEHGPRRPSLTELRRRAVRVAGTARTACECAARERQVAKHAHAWLWKQCRGSPLLPRAPDPHESWALSERSTERVARPAHRGPVWPVSS